VIFRKELEKGTNPRFKNKFLQQSYGFRIILIMLEKYQAIYTARPVLSIKSLNY
jgi:hypothetical protein